QRLRRVRDPLRRARRPDAQRHPVEDGVRGARLHVLRALPPLRALARDRSQCTAARASPPRSQGRRPVSAAGAPAPPPEEAAEFYDAMWRRYAHLDAVSPAAFHRRRLVVELAARASPAPRRILDVGCGQGELLDELAARFPGSRITGADISAEALADSRARS